MSEWKQLLWGDIATLEYGRALRGYQEVMGPVQVFGTNGPVGWTSESQSDGPGVIIGRKGAYRGVHYSEGPFWVIDTAYYLKPKCELDLKWAYYALKNQDINSMDSGSAIPSTSRADFYALSVNLPPLANQRAIAAVLGALDDKIAVNERIANTLDSLSMALYQAHSESKSGTDGWREGTLAEICSTQYGYTVSADPEAVGPKFLRVTDMNKRNWIDWSSVPRCPDPGESKAKYALVFGDILVARMADPGKAAIVEQEVDAVFASYLVRLKTPSLAHSYYVFGFLKSDAYLDYVQGAKSGSVQANMNAKTIIAAKISIPPVSLMESHLAHVLPLRQKIAATVQESLALARLRDALLPGLMSGAIRVRDAEKAVEDAI